MTDRKRTEVSNAETKKILEAVFQHHGIKRKRATYWLGNIPEVQILPSEIATVEQTQTKTGLEAKHDWKRLTDYCQKLVDSSVSRLLHKYDSQLYVHRKNAEKQFSNFLKSTKNLFLLVGKSGTGKTNLLCHLARSTKSPSMFFSGDLCPVGIFSLQEELDMHLKSLWHNSPNISDFMTHVDYLLRKNKKNFVVFLDALNEFNDPVLLSQELAVLASRWGILYPTIKLCISCRTSSWKSIEASQKATLPRQNLYVHEVTIPMNPILNQFSELSATVEDFDDKEFSEDFALDLAATMRKMRVKRLPEGQFSDIPTYSEDRLISDNYSYR